MAEQKHIETVVLPESLRQARRAERERKNDATGRAPARKAANPSKQPK